MSVTLSAAQADLLAQVGQPWPVADEDHIAAMADGWRRLSLGLDDVRSDHRDAARSIMAAGTGDAVRAFGDWSSESDDIILRIIEIMARLEALMISVADGLYEVKTKIVAVLDDLSRAIDQVERDAAEVPVVGGALVVGVEVLLRPLYIAAHTAITGIVTALTWVVVDVEVPAFVALTELFKGLEQDLRKLNGTGAGADPTTPSGWADPRNRPRGEPEVPEPTATPRKRRDLHYQNEAALILAQAGYDVEQLPISRTPGVKNPDYRINGRIFDGYSPTTPRARNIWTRIEEDKVNEGQADRVIININAPDARATVADLRRQFQEYPIPGLKEVKVIGAGGAIIDIYP